MTAMVVIMVTMVIHWYDRFNVLATVTRTIRISLMVLDELHESDLILVDVDYYHRLLHQMILFSLKTKILLQILV